MPPKKGKQKTVTKAQVRDITSELGELARGLRDGVEFGRKVNVDNSYLLNLLEKARRAIIQLERP